MINVGQMEDDLVGENYYFGFSLLILYPPLLFVLEKITFRLDLRGLGLT